MATNQQTTEIIPSTKLDDLESVLAELKTEAEALPILKKQAVDLVVTNEAEYKVAADLLLQVRSIGKSGALKINPFMEKVNRVATYLRNFRTRHEDEAGEIANIISGKMAEQKRQERLAAEAEQRRINEQARLANEQKAETERKAAVERANADRVKRIAEINRALKAKEITKSAAARLLREAGAIAESQTLQADADAEVMKAEPPKVVVTPNVPKVSGIRGRVQYLAEIESTDLLLSAYVVACASRNIKRMAYLRQFITLDEQRLGKEAREVKNSAKLNAEIPGVRFWDEDKV